ncbi:MAG: flippase-like domain-containing protein [Bacteroidales bacterium]|nr:flippase-like domain-containing protein [Bacteroidales bacterium]
MTPKKGVVRALKFTAFLILGLLLLFLAFRNTDIAELRTALSNADYRWVFIAFATSIAAFISRARRWLLLIQPLGYNPSLKNVFNALLSGYLANMALPRMGEVTRCVLLNRKEKIPVDKLFGTVILERVIDFISLLIIMATILIASYDSIGPFMKDQVLIPLSEKVTLLFGSTLTIRIITISSFIIILVLLFIFRKRLLGEKIYPRIRSFASGVIHGIKSIKTMEHKWEFLFHSVFIWVGYIVMTWVIVFVLPATSHLGLGDAVFLLVIGGLGMSAPVQSGLGAFHWIISRGLHLVYGIPLSDGLAYALVSHTSQMVLIAILGTISMSLIIHGTTRSEK